MQKSKKPLPYKFFGVLFLLILSLVLLNNFRKSDTVSLSVPDNAGVSFLEMIGTSLVSVFQDGRVVSWDWSAVPQQKGDFRAVSDRVVLLDAQHLAAVSTKGKKVLTVYSLPDGQKQKDISVGWDDQDLWPRISPDKKTVALVRRNGPDSKGSVLYEFLTLDIEKERTGSTVPLSVQEGAEDLVDYTTGDNGVLYAVGSRENTGRIAAVDLEKGTVLWDSVFEDTKEFCSISVSPDSSFLYVGNRDGVLYKLNAQTGEIIKNIKLLKDGETRPITNDYSVLNTAFSPDGQYFVATIHPMAYILKTDSDKIFYTCKPANRLVSKIAFSPDNRFFATSDIRAGYPVKVWPMPVEKQP